MPTGTSGSSVEGALYLAILAFLKDRNLQLSSDTEANLVIPVRGASEELEVPIFILFSAAFRDAQLENRSKR